MIDRTSKLLLAVIALGLWLKIGIALFRPSPTSAQTRSDICFQLINGKLTLINGELQQIEGTASTIGSDLPGFLWVRALTASSARPSSAVVASTNERPGGSVDYTAMSDPPRRGSVVAN